jgi:hypothetical protein
MSLSAIGASPAQPASKQSDNMAIADLIILLLPKQFTR